MKPIDQLAEEYTDSVDTRVFGCEETLDATELIKQAYIAGAAEALRSQWISVEDALPDDEQEILIYSEYIGAKSGERRTLIEQYIYFKQYEKDGFRLKERTERHLKLKVLYWMPIPPTPKSDKP